MVKYAEFLELQICNHKIVLKWSNPQHLSSSLQHFLMPQLFLSICLLAEKHGLQLHLSASLFGDELNCIKFHLKGSTFQKLFNTTTQDQLLLLLKYTKHHQGSQQKATKLYKPATWAKRTCRCRNKHDHSLDGNHFNVSVINRATISSNHGVKHYIGLSDVTFKAHYTSHKFTFNDEDKRNSTEISKYIFTTHATSSPSTMRQEKQHRTLQMRMETQ